MAKKSSQAAAAAPAGGVRSHNEGDWFSRLAARKLEFKIAFLIVVAISLVFWQSFGFAFLDYGDSAALTDNPVVQSGWTTIGLRYAFASLDTGAWQPVAWLSHMTDFAVLGIDAGSHHFVNVLVHVLNSLLLFGLLVAFTGARWRSGLVALLFAVHPLQVESVAWLSERRTLLGGFFSLAGAWAWLRSHDNKRCYWWSIVSFALAVMSNAAVAPMALIFVLLDRWPGRRAPRWSAAIPLFAVGAGGLTVWFWSLTQSGGTTPIPLGARVANAAASIGEYLGTVAWPVNLAAFYPARMVVPVPLIAAGLGVLVLFTALALWQRTQRPYLLTGWLWFLLLLVPVLGIVPMGALSRADRFMYLPLAGVLVGVVWGVHSIAAKWEQSLAMPAVAGLAVLLCTWASWAQTSYWRGDIVLFEHALKVTGDANRVAHSQIGSALVRLNQVEYALSHLQKAIELDPQFAPSYRQLAEALYKREMNRGSLDMLNKAIALDPGSARSYADRGRVLRALDRLDEAYDSFEQGLKMGLDLNVRMDAYFNQGMIRSKQTRYPEAIERFQQALELDPYFYLARKNLAFTYLRAEKYFEAEREFGLLVRTNSNDEDVVKAMRFLRQRIK